MCDDIGMTIEVRRVRPEDGRALYEIRLLSLATEPSAFCTTHGEEAARGPDVWGERAVRGSQGRGTATFLAWDAADVVGVVVMIPEARPSVAEPVGMWGSLPRRDATRRTGACRSLVAAGLAWASDSGFEEVILHVANWNDEAAAFYAGLGFEFTGIERLFGGPGGMVARELRRSPLE